jgi:arsenite methyltransferase
MAELHDGMTVLDLGSGGALTRDEYADHLAAEGLTDIEITETHRVHEHAGSAIIHARKPA